MNYQTRTAPRRVGLIVLKTDEIIEREIAQILPLGPDLVLHVSRIFFPPDVTESSLAQMKQNLPASASLLPDVPFDAVGYGCTSGATVIGSDNVSDLIRMGCHARTVLDPIASVFQAIKALNLSKLAVLTPYIPSVSQAIEQKLEDQGIRITSSASFNILSDPVVAQVSPASILEGLIKVGQGDCDGVFVSCTNLAALPVIEEAEARLKKPVISSNQALGWALAKALGIQATRGFGRLFQV